MDSQLKEVLASMQEMAKMRGNTERVLAENERILGENENMRGEIKSMRGEIERLSNENEGLHEGNERINNDLASVRKDLDTARVTHTQDVEALRIVSRRPCRSPTLTMTPPGHFVVNPLTSSRPARPCT
jgi:predicted nuclease with TOPRIM domain